MDFKKRYWMYVLSSLVFAKNEDWITKKEYGVFKGKFKKYLDEKKYEEKHTDYSSWDNCISKDELYDDVEIFFELDDDTLADKINKYKRIDLYHILDFYNWDDGFRVPAQILKHHDCDLALAMKIFDLADGDSFIEDCFINGNEPDVYNEDWWNFCSSLFNDMGEGKFKIDDTPGELSVAYIIVLLKKGIFNNLTNDYKFLLD